MLSYFTACILHFNKIQESFSKRGLFLASVTSRWIIFKKELIFVVSVSFDQKFYGIFTVFPDFLKPRKRLSSSGKKSPAHAHKHEYSSGAHIRPPKVARLSQSFKRTS